MRGLRHIMRAGLAVLMLAGAGCSSDAFWSQEAVLFDGIEFRQKSAPVDRKTPRNFEVSVRPVSASLEGAREAAKYEATRYCVNRYGNSDLKWDNDPDGEALLVRDDTLILQGRCDPRTSSAHIGRRRGR